MKKIAILLVAALMTGTGACLADNKAKNEKKSVTTVFTTDIDCEHCSKKILNTIPYEKGVKVPRRYRSPTTRPRTMTSR